jgi:flagellar biosynthesis/type III secretory pathway M-ring protein FliF/YscJ
LALADRRRCLIVSVFVPLAALAAFDARQRPDEFEAIASGLTRAETDAVQDHLDGLRVPYLIRDGGQTVLVPAARRAELTIELTRNAALRSKLSSVHPSLAGRAASSAKGAVSPDRPARGTNARLLD